MCFITPMTPTSESGAYHAWIHLAAILTWLFVPPTGFSEVFMIILFFEDTHIPDKKPLVRVLTLETEVTMRKKRSHTPSRVSSSEWIVPE